jgi:hypothetical protein
MAQWEWQLTVDGDDYTGEFAGLAVDMPSVVHEIPPADGTSRNRRVLGPSGLSLTITEPSERLAALVDGGKRVYQVKAAMDCGETRETLSAVMQFHASWTDPDESRKTFASVYVGLHHKSVWITEPKINSGGLADAAPGRRGGK